MKNPQEGAQNLLIFNSSGMNCAFPLEGVREVVPMASLASPPGLPSGLAGFLDLRGTAIPILRMDRLLDLPEQQPSLHSPMIVLHGVLGPIGILAQSVRGIEQVSASQLLSIPPGNTFCGCATATVQLDGDLVHVLSPALLLHVNEARLLADYSAMAQARHIHIEAGK
jgi:purine-binding chemotaxis protein CheW